MDVGESMSMWFMNADKKTRDESADESDEGSISTKASPPMSQVASLQAARAALPRKKRARVRIHIFPIHFHSYIPMACTSHSPNIS